VYKEDNPFKKTLLLFKCKAFLKACKAIKKL